MLYRSQILTLTCFFFTTDLSAANAPVDFAREVLPILSDKCFVCHGPDTQKKDQLRLDSEAGATADRGGYQSINPTSPTKSEFLKRIFAKEDPMPPLDAERQLSNSDRSTLKRWIMAGGNYTKHWAFVPPTRIADRSIDRMIGEQLSQAGITFAAKAEWSILARRAALTLTGLPPEPKQLATFLSDPSPQTYSAFIEQLLSSKRFGEHQARYWLDAVRYGDTHGLHLDNRRGIYPYRDWVVRAFNEGLPFDKFIEWQLAGDLLPNPTLEQQVATGFVRLNPTTGEGGAIPEEFQAKNNFDRVENLGTALLGISLTCARCHTHKYDPIQQKEYYQLMAFFNSTAEPAMDGNAYRYGPTAKVPEHPAAWDRWNKLKLAHTALLSKFPKASLVQLQGHAELTTHWKSSDWLASPVVNRGGKTPAEKSWKPIKGFPGTADSLPRKPGQFRWFSFKLTTPIYQTLWLSFNGAEGFGVELDGESITTKQRAMPLVLSPGEHTVKLKLIGSPDRIPVEIHLRNAWEKLAKSKSWEQCNETDRLKMLGDSKGPPIPTTLREPAFRLSSELAVLEANFTTTLVAKDLPKPRETKILERGEYHLRIGAPLQPGVLAAMGGLKTDSPKNRLGLAKWLTAPDQPLVARVLINRVWQRVFGYGLVRTPEDFGRQGEQPTHPELLDWLAVEFQESGWDLKHMVRLMLNSRTLQQSSAIRSDIADPENRLFARGPRQRLDAEIIRDIGLWASQLLDPHMGGEGVKPHQPAGMWKALTHPGSNTVNYEPDTGKRVYRRSLYVYWKRTSPHPMMTLFDSPSREASCVRRSQSNTPVQSLGLFNEPQRLEMARHLAARLLKTSGDQARLNELFTLLASREPNATERKACRQLLASMRERFRAAPEEARQFLGTGQAKTPTGMESINPTELAAWSQVTGMLLASDLAIMLY
jgi:mono/diheme cytochrome c family protein